MWILFVFCFFGAFAKIAEAKAFDFDDLEKALKDIDATLVDYKHGHSLEEAHGHSLERHGHSLEHEMDKRMTDIGEEEIEREEQELQELIDEVEANQEPEGDRVTQAESDAEASRVEAALKEEESKLLADGEKAFQEFDKNINDAIKQSEAVETEVRKDIDEQSEHRIQD